MSEDLNSEAVDQKKSDNLLDLMDSDIISVVQEEKWTHGGAMKSIVGRLVTAIHTETADICIGAVIGASKIMNDKSCFQNDHKMAKACIQECFAELLAKGGRNGFIRSIVKTSLEVSQNEENTLAGFF